MEAFNIGSFVIQVINLGIVIGILYAFLFKPYLKYVVEQEQKTKDIDEAHTKVDTLQQKTEAENRAVLQQAQKQAQEIREQAEVSAKKQAEKIVADAQHEASIVQQKAEVEIEKNRESLMAEVRGQITGAALKINEKLF